ncbi:TadE family type IV pilus minor pilin [Saccharomonospora sp. NPDC006951]
MTGPPCGPARGERGSVTVEGAIALCALVAVFGVVVAGIGIAADVLRCTDAAGQAARLVAKGQSELAKEAVRRTGPDGAEVDIKQEGRLVVVTVSAEAVGGLVPGGGFSARAYAELEPGVTSTGDAPAPEPSKEPSKEAGQGSRPESRGSP